MAEEHEVYVKCSSCQYEGAIRIGDDTSIYDVVCPQCGCRTLFLYYFISPIAGG